MSYAAGQTWAPALGVRAERRATAIDFATGALALLILLTFSQGWISPIFGAAADPSSGGAIRTLYFPAYLAGLALLVLNAGDVIRVLVRQPMLVLQMGLVVASITWSIDPGETMRRVIAIGFTTLAGVVLAARYSWPRLVEIMATAFGLLCLASLFMGLAVPHIGRMPAGSEFPGAWRGLWAEKNAMGDNMALFMPAFVASAIYHPRRRKLWIGAALLCFGLLLLSTSKTSLVAMMLAMTGAAFVAIVRKGPAWAVVATWLGVLAAGGLAAAFLLAPTEIYALLGKDATLTGRTQIWAAIMRQVHQRPWLGHGYGTIWTDQGQWTPLAWIVKDAHFTPHHAHSSWYEQLIQLGYVGLGAWVLVYAQTVITGLVAVFREKGAFLAFPFLLVYSMISLTESITLTYNDLRWVLFVAIACKLAFPDRLQEQV